MKLLITPAVIRKHARTTRAELVVLPTKEYGQHLDVPLLSAWTKPIDGTIQSQIAKARQEIVA